MRAAAILALCAVGLVAAWATLALVDGGEGVAVLSGTDPGSLFGAAIGLVHLVVRLAALVLGPPLALAAVLLAVPWREIPSLLARR